MLYVFRIRRVSLAPCGAEDYSALYPRLLKAAGELPCQPDQDELCITSALGGAGISTVGLPYYFTGVPSTCVQGSPLFHCGKSESHRAAISHRRVPASGQCNRLQDRLLILRL